MNKKELKMQRVLLMDLLTKVAYELAVVIDEKRLLWMLGYKYNKPSAWADLLELWVELGFSENALQMTNERDKCVLVSVTSAICPMKEWSEADTD
jgi:hypothetical protein